MKKIVKPDSDKNCPIVRIYVLRKPVGSKSFEKNRQIKECKILFHIHNSIFISSSQIKLLAVITLRKSFDKYNSDFGKPIEINP